MASVAVTVSSGDTSVATPVVKQRLVPVKTKIRIKREDLRQCRLCMRVVHRDHIRETVPLGKGSELRRKILDAVSVKITSRDAVQSVCLNCAMIVNMIHEFRMSCRNADMMHRQKRMMLHSKNWLSDENRLTLDGCYRLLKRNRTEIDELFRVSGLDKANLYELTKEVRREEEIPPEAKDQPREEPTVEPVVEEPMEEPREAPEINFERVDVVAPLVPPVGHKRMRPPMGRKGIKPPVVSSVIKPEEIADSDPEMSEQCAKTLDAEEVKRLIMASREYQMCEICGELVQKGYLEGHMNKHAGIRPYQCPVEGCGKTFHSSRVRSAHVSNAHRDPEKRIECEVCHRSLKNATVYKVHLLTHQADNTLKVPCEVCGKKFYKRYLRDHMFVHTGEMPYECEFCGRKFAARNNWTVHKRKQHPERIQAEQG